MWNNVFCVLVILCISSCRLLMISCCGISWLNILLKVLFIIATVWRFKIFITIFGLLGSPWRLNSWDIFLVWRYANGLSSLVSNWLTIINRNGIAFFVMVDSIFVRIKVWKTLHRLFSRVTTKISWHGANSLIFIQKIDYNLCI